MPSMNAAEIDAFLAESRVAVLASVSPGDHLHQAPVWYEYEDGRFYVWTSANSPKARNIERNPEASVCVATHNEPYRYVSASGPVEMLSGDITARCLSICRRYYDEERAQEFVRTDLAAGDSVVLILTARRLVSEHSA